MAAALLVESGHEVVGATMKLWGGASDAGCCTVDDVEDARRVADQLGIAHRVFNFSEDFEARVVDPYVAAHAAGATPNPCIECNRHLKFRRFLDQHCVACHGPDVQKRRLRLDTLPMAFGEKDPAGAAVAGVQAIVIGIAISLLVGIPCAFFAPRLLALMGASSQIIAVGGGYARIALGGSGAIMLLFLNNAIFRGAGDAAIAMRLLWVSNIINLVLDPCLIFGWGPFPKLGVTGAALATFTGRSIGVLYQFYRLLRGTERIRILRRQVRVALPVLWRLVRVSLTGILQFAIAHTSWIGLVRIVSVFGSAALAGYTIAQINNADPATALYHPRIPGLVSYDIFQKRSANSMQSITTRSSGGGWSGKR